MATPMKCWRRGHRGETWTLDLDRDRAVLRDAAGVVRGEFTHAEAAGQFLMPFCPEHPVLSPPGGRANLVF